MIHRLLILFSVITICATAQPVDTMGYVNKTRLRTVVISSSVAYGVSLAGLSQLWYKNSERQSFQFFNDNREWKQMDKLGHVFSSFYLSYGTSRALQWCNIPAKKSDVIGAITAFSVLLPIEILDGFSNAYGASTGDLLANAGGTSLYLIQKHLWRDVRIIPKFSFRSTHYASLRPEILGNSASEEILKDYNGQTYWLSIKTNAFVKFPIWLNLAVGYGANGMIYARDEQNILAGYEKPYRQYFFSVDFNLMSIRTNSKVVKTLLFIVNTLKLPAPALEFSRQRMRVHALYF